MNRNYFSTRVNLRLPNEVYDEIVNIAIQNESPINPRTGKITITSTVVSLLKLGIESAKEKGYYLHHDKQE